MEFSDPRIIKLLKSTQAAFPLGRDPWADLAHGLSAAREEIAIWMTQLQENGAALGICAEPNVQHPSIGESLDFDSDDVESARWNAPISGGRLVSSWRKSGHDMSGWQAKQWFKIGIMLDVGAEPTQWNPFEPSTDRTMKPEAPMEWAIPQESNERHLAAFSRTHRIDPAKQFWDSFGTDYTESSAREAVQQLLIHRLARRFSLRLSPKALGWHGCGLACWSLDSQEVERAAGALASVSCSGDVVIRKPTADWPFNLSAVVLGLEPDSGKKTAAEISRRWGRDLGRWIEFESMG